MTVNITAFFILPAPFLILITGLTVPFNIITAGDEIQEIREGSVCF